jgi:general nucleoside transport system permease protein
VKDLHEAAITSLVPVAALAGALVLAGLAVTISGKSAPDALLALTSGAFGSADRLSETALKTIPLLLAGLGVAVAFRAGVWNIGAEGQLYVGALAVAWLASVWAGAGALLGMAAGTVAGAAWALIAALLRTRRGVQEVISTIMLNFIAILLVSWAVNGPLMEAQGRYPWGEEIPAGMRLARLLPGTRIHVGVLVAIICAVAVWWLLFRTVAGYRLRAVGSNPRALAFAGLSVERYVLLAMLISGALAGLAGAIEVQGVAYRLYERVSPGYGYTAIAVALLGRLSPGGVAAGALLFGALESGAGAMQREAGVPAVLVYVIQGLTICLLAAGMVLGKRWRLYDGTRGDATADG